GQGQWHDYRVRGDRPGKKSGRYILSLDSRPRGWAGCRKRGVKFTWTPNKSYAAPTAAELEKKRRKRRAPKREKQEVREAARKSAERLWSAAEEPDQHPYLQRKGIRSHGLRVGTWENSYYSERHD